MIARHFDVALGMGRVFWTHWILGMVWWTPPVLAAENEIGVLQNSPKMQCGRNLFPDPFCWTFKVYIWDDFLRCFRCHGDLQTWSLICRISPSPRSSHNTHTKKSCPSRTICAMAARVLPSLHLLVTNSTIVVSPEQGRFVHATTQNMELMLVSWPLR